jgi:AraC-like DNA-binding protein
MVDLIRASALQGFAQCVRELDGDPDELLAVAGIRLEHAGDGEVYIPFQAHAALLAHAAAALDCADFGLRLSTRRGIEILGPVALAGRHARTVKDGFEALARYVHVFNPSTRISVSPLRTDEVRYEQSIPADLAAPAQVTELALATGVQAARALIGEHFRPVRISLPHAPVSPPAHYREFFDTEVAFGQTHCSFDFHSDDLDRPLRGNDPLVREVATHLLESPDYASPQTPETALRAIIAQSLATGHCTLVEVAEALHLHPRTLQRHLAAENLSFEHVLADVRRDRARHYLENTTMPLADLSALLGYSEQSSFTRACRAWFGVPPRSVRQAASQVT